MGDTFDALIQEATRKLEQHRTAKMMGQDITHRAALEESLLMGVRLGLEKAKVFINTPRTDDFLHALVLEAAHQTERWGTNHDAGKRSEDWFALMVYLLGKACNAHYIADNEKLKHHIITVSAACLNWFRAITGENTRMRPGLAD
jgi:hypothetical protein